MWRGGFGGLVCAVIFGASLPGVASAADPRSVMTERQMEQLSPRQANQKAGADLLSLLKPIRRLKNVDRYNQVWLETQSVGTEFAGLCRKDVVLVKYAPTERRSASKDRPLRPYGIEAHQEFHVLAQPTAGYRGLIWDKRCENLAPWYDGVSWFAAEDAEQAARAVHWYRAAREQLLAGKLHATACDMFPATKMSCDALILKFGDDPEIMRVRSCDNRDGGVCLALDIGLGMQLTIVGRVGPDDPAPGSISFVSAAELVLIM